MRSIAVFPCALVLAVALAACGGGGGDSGGGSGAPVTFTPGTLSATYASGTSAAVTVRASTRDTSLFAGGVYVYVVDSNQLLLSGVDLSQVDGNTMAATVHTSPSTPAGHYQGNFQIQLCKTPNCSSQLPGSPVALPYDFTVTPGSTSGGGDPGTLTFLPSSLTSNVAAGSSTTLTVQVIASNATLSASYPVLKVTDSAQVLTASIEQTRLASTTVAATLHTSPSLGVGHYQGNLMVALCSNTACTAQAPGSPFALPFDLTVTPAPLSALAQASTSGSVHRGANLATQVPVTVAGAKLDWTATTATEWLTIIGAPSGVGAGQITVGYAPQNLTEGSYTGSVVVRSTDGQSVTIPFSLAVLPTQFVLNSGVPTFTAVNGAPIAGKSLSFSLDNGVPSAWTATSSANWLTANPQSGTTPALVTLQPDPTRGPLPSGTYTADLVLASPGYPSKTISTQLTLTKPSLTSSASSLTLGGTNGRNLTPQSLMLNMNTGANSWPYTLSTVPAWLTSSSNSGTVNQSGSTLTLTPNPSGITPGSVSAALTVTANVNGDVVNLPITLNLNADQRRLLASASGIAFSSTPTGTTLTRTLTVRDNFAGTLAWTAASDAAWLSVTASGSTGNGSNLTVTADASGLPSGAMSYATVTVNTAASGVAPAVVRVGVWKDASGLSAITKLPINYATIAADTIRPYIYANTGGTTIDVYNAYTTQKVTTITAAGSALGRMTVSSDGGHLYALDTATRSISVIDLSTFTKTASWPANKALTSNTDVLAIRPNGVEVVFVGDGTAYADGRSLGTTTLFGPLSATADGTTVATFGSRYSVDQSAVSGGVVLVKYANNLNVSSGGNETDAVISPDGTRAYGASGGGVSGGGYRCGIADAVDGSYIGALPGGDAYPNNVEVTRDGRAICGISGWYSTYDIWVHSPAGALLQGYKFAGYAKALKPRELLVTPDGFVAIGLTDDPEMAFVPIGP